MDHTYQQVMVDSCCKIAPSKLVQSASYTYRDHKQIAIRSIRKATARLSEVLLLHSQVFGNVVAPMPSALFAYIFTTSCIM